MNFRRIRPWTTPAVACVVQFTLLLLGATCVPFSRAANSTAAYLADVWTADEGLPDSSVTALAQTPDGYLWIGTYNGLVRFDGHRFVTFDPANAPALAHARVRQLAVDAAGTLWINTQDGSMTSLCRGVFAREWTGPDGPDPDATLVASSSNRVVFLLHRGSFRFKPAAAPAGMGWEDFNPPLRSVGALCAADGTGTIWYRLSNKRLARWRDGKFEPLDESAGLGDQPVTALTTDPDGHLWVGTERGVLKWDGTQFRTMTPTNAAPAEVGCLSVAADGSFWALVNGSWRKAVDRRWVAEAEEIRGLFRGMRTHLGTQDDHQGGLWIYDYGLGVMHVGGDGLVHRFGPANGFPGDRVSCFLEDREGNWWAGVDAGGLARIRERRFQTIDVGGDVSTKPAKSVCQESNGTLWIATLGDGLLRGQAGVFTNVTVPGGTEKGFAFCATPDHQGRLWVSAGDEDLYVREGETFRRVTPVVHGVKSLLADRAGRIWAGTKSGLSWAGPAAPFNFAQVSGVARASIRALAEDPRGDIWAGSEDGTLYQIKTNTTTAFRPRDERFPDVIWSLLADEDGAVWIGTFRGGLLRFRDGHFVRYQMNDGLPDNVVCQIVPDGLGNLWFGSHHGIFRIPRTALEEFAAGEIKSLPALLFGRSDGLPSLECSSRYQPAAWRAADGRLWFTTIKGAVSVLPGTVRPNLLQPPVVIEEILVDGKHLNAVMRSTNNPPPLVKVFDHERRYLEVAPGKHQFEFRYTGLSLVASDRVQFQYRLLNADADWVEAGARRFAQYNFLPPGRYQFQVIACNSDGVWNRNGQTLTLVVLPHFYETLWFRLLVALVAAGSVAGVARYVATRRLQQKMVQLARQQAVERERARIAKDIHDDLGANLTLIAVLGDLAKKEKTAERIEKMAGTARQSVKSLDEIVWAVNPRNDTLAHLIDYTGQFAVDYLRAAGIRCLLDLPEHAPVREVPANMRHNVFLVVKEALQNVVKHAGATAVWLRISAPVQGLRIVIEDNGRGFESAPEDALADGLRNMRQRMDEIGGTCRIQSHAGSGAEVIVELPWPAD
ncbi:MAG TPA: two-component regulator propeller domain-containing protein [Verrucomicrobiae bacterium]|nr:two-component regulator propeller domain-containing protein [Verrucomicrobiae bacterium]